MCVWNVFVVVIGRRSMRVTSLEAGTGRRPHTPKYPIASIPESLKSRFGQFLLCRLWGCYWLGLLRVSREFGSQNEIRFYVSMSSTNNVRFECLKSGNAWCCFCYICCCHWLGFHTCHAWLGTKWQVWRPNQVLGERPCLGYQWEAFLRVRNLVLGGSFSVGEGIMIGWLFDVWILLTLTNFRAAS